MSDLEDQIENRLGYVPDGEFVNMLPQDNSYSFKNYYLTGKYRFRKSVSMNAWFLIPLFRQMDC